MTPPQLQPSQSQIQLQNQQRRDNQREESKILNIDHTVEWVDLYALFKPIYSDRSIVLDEEQKQMFEINDT